MKEFQDDSDSSSSSRSYSGPQTRGIPQVSDNENSNDEEESCESVYMEGPDDVSTCSQTAVSTDEESAPMDEAADRKKARIVQPPPTPTPMDEEAIDATIRRNLKAANEIIKKQPPRSDIPFIAGLTELDNV